MRDGLKAGKAKEAAGAFDRVHEAEDVVERRFVARVGLKANQLGVDDLEVFSRFGQKFGKEIVHAAALARESVRAVEDHLWLTNIEGELTQACATAMRGLRIISSMRSSASLAIRARPA